MKVVVAGSSGLIGTALLTALRREGHTVIGLVRRASNRPDEVRWSPSHATLDPTTFDEVDAVVNLCGAGIGDRRWTGSYKQLLRDSRITPTDVLAQAVARAQVPVLLNASAIGYYGDTGDRQIDENTEAPSLEENSEAESNFLATLCRDWEAATAPAAAAGVRTVLVRSGMVLSSSGGLLARLVPLYRFGLGARLGNGKQYFPWISLTDEIGAILCALDNPMITGPVNAVAPNPITAGEFHETLARLLHRPAFVSIPGSVLRAVLGEFATAGILQGQRAKPTVLQDAGYQFRYDTIESALEAALGQYR